jgi:hypothetical protein
MHLHNLQVERRPEDLRGFPRQPEKRIHPHAVVRGKDYRDLIRRVANARHLSVAVPGRTDHQGLIVLHATGQHEFQRAVMRKIDDRVALGYCTREVVADVHGRPRFAIPDRLWHTQ